jgi:hypothetical protein
MATREQIGEALKAAHAAGDVENARKLAIAYKNFSGISSLVAPEPDKEYAGFFGSMKEAATTLGAADEAAAFAANPTEENRQALLKAAESKYKTASFGLSPTEDLSVLGRNLEALKEVAGGSLGFLAAPIAAGAVTGGIGGYGTAAAQYGVQNIARQAQEQQAAIEAGRTPEELSLGKAAVAAAGQTALDVAGGRIFGPLLSRFPLLKNLAIGGKPAQESVDVLADAVRKGKLEIPTAGGIARGVGKGVAFEAPQEMAQQALELWQAGVPTEQWKDELVQSAIGGALLGGPMGGVQAKYAAPRQQLQERQKRVFDILLDKYTKQGMTKEQAVAQAREDIQTGNFDIGDAGAVRLRQEADKQKQEEEASQLKALEREVNKLADKELAKKGILPFGADFLAADALAAERARKLGLSPEEPPPTITVPKSTIRSDGALEKQVEDRLEGGLIDERQAKQVLDARAQGVKPFAAGTLLEQLTAENEARGATPSVGATLTPLEQYAKEQEDRAKFQEDFAKLEGQEEQKEREEREKRTIPSIATSTPEALRSLVLKRASEGLLDPRQVFPVFELLNQGFEADAAGRRLDRIIQGNVAVGALPSINDTSAVTQTNVSSVGQLEKQIKQGLEGKSIDGQQAQQVRRLQELGAPPRVAGMLLNTLIAENENRLAREQPKRDAIAREQAERRRGALGRAIESRIEDAQLRVGEENYDPYADVETAFTEELVRDRDANPAPTEEERNTIARVVRLALDEFKAEETDTDIVPSAPEATQLEGMEALIPERKEEVGEPVQPSLPFMSRRKGLERTRQVEPELEPQGLFLTEGILDELGVAKKDNRASGIFGETLRNAVVGMPLSDPDVQQALIDYTKNQGISDTSRANIERLLGTREDAGQLELFESPRARETRIAEERKQLLSNLAQAYESRHRPYVEDALSAINAFNRDYSNTTNIITANEAAETARKYLKTAQDVNKFEQQLAEGARKPKRKEKEKYAKDLETLSRQVSVPATDVERVKALGVAVTEKAKPKTVPEADTKLIARAIDKLDELSSESLEGKSKEDRKKLRNQLRDRLSAALTTVDNVRRKTRVSFAEQARAGKERPVPKGPLTDIRSMVETAKSANLAGNIEETRNNLLELKGYLNEASWETLFDVDPSLKTTKTIVSKKDISGASDRDVEKTAKLSDYTGKPVQTLEDIEREEPVSAREDITDVVYKYILQRLKKQRKTDAEIKKELPLASSSTPITALFSPGFEEDFLSVFETKQPWRNKQRAESFINKAKKDGDITNDNYKFLMSGLKSGANPGLQALGAVKFARINAQSAKRAAKRQDAVVPERSSGLGYAALRNSVSEKQWAGILKKLSLDESALEGAVDSTTYVRIANEIGRVVRAQIKKASAELFAQKEARDARAAEERKARVEKSINGFRDAVLRAKDGAKEWKNLLRRLGIKPTSLTGEMEQSTYEALAMETRKTLDRLELEAITSLVDTPAVRASVIAKFGEGERSEKIIKAYSELIKSRRAKGNKNIPPPYTSISGRIVFRRNYKPASGMLAEKVRDIVGALTKDWKSDLNVEVVQNVDQLPKNLAVQVLSVGADKVAGLAARDGNTVFIIANNLSSASDVKATLFHEALGHAGLARAFGARLDSILQAIYSTNEQYRKKADAWLAANKDAYVDESNRELRALEEVLAEESEKGKINPTLLGRIVSAIKDFARKIGINTSYSNADVAAVLSAAHNIVMEGGKRAPTLEETDPKVAFKIKKAEDLQNKILREENATKFAQGIGDLAHKFRDFDDVKSFLKNTVSSFSTPATQVLGFVASTSQLAELYASKLPALRNFVKAEIEGNIMRGGMHGRMGKFMDIWMQFSRAYPKGADAMAAALNSASVANFDPRNRYSGQLTPVEQAAKQYYDALGKYPGGQKLFSDIIADGKDGLKKEIDTFFSALDDKLLPGDIKDPSTPKGLLYAERQKAYEALARIEVYFPRSRFGKYSVTIGEADTDGYEHYRFESRRVRDDFRRILEKELKDSKDSRADTVRTYDTSKEAAERIASAPETQLGKISKILDSQKITPEDREALMDAAYQLYTRTLPNKSATKRVEQLQRMNVTGASMDAFRSFAAHKYAANNRLHRATFGPVLRNIVSDMKLEAENAKSTEERERLRAVVNEINRRVDRELDPSYVDDDFMSGLDKVARLGQQATFLSFLTGAKQLVVQFSSLPMVAAPVFAGRYGVSLPTMLSKIGSHLRIDTEELALFNKNSSLQKFKDARARDAFSTVYDELELAGFFDETRIAEASAMGKSPAVGETSLARGTDKVMKAMRFAFQTSETATRKAAFATAFEYEYSRALAQNKSKDEALQQARDNAIQAVYDTLFNYTLWDRPRLFTAHPTLRVATQFMLFPLQYSALFIRAFHKYAFSDLATKEEKRAAATQFWGLMGMAGIFGGITGLPMYTAVTLTMDALSALFDDEDDDDDNANPFFRKNSDFWIKNWLIPNTIGSGSGMAKIFGLSEDMEKLYDRSLKYGPVSALTGLNIYSSVSAAEMPFMYFMDRDLLDKDPEAVTYSFLFGPTGSLAKNWMTGIKDIWKGDTIRGVEQFLPAAFRGTATAVRYATEGNYTRSDREVEPAEYYTATKLFMQAAGFKDTVVFDNEEKLYAMFKISKKINAEKIEIYKRLEQAYKERDFAKVKQIIRDDVVNGFNKDYPGLRINKADIKSSLENRLRGRQEAERAGGMNLGSRGLNRWEREIME